MLENVDMQKEKKKTLHKDDHMCTVQKDYMFFLRIIFCLQFTQDHLCAYSFASAHAPTSSTSMIFLF